MDISSYTDVLVYDNNKWVGYMGPIIKKVRSLLYTAWGMAGISDWATDLQKYYNPPAPAESWGGYKAGIFAETEESETDHSRNGNWTDFSCEHPVIANPYEYTPSDRWTLMNGDAAWADIVRIYKDTDSKRSLNFIQSLHETVALSGLSRCGNMDYQVCGTDECEKGLDDPESGPAAHFIVQSLSKIHHLYHRYDAALLWVSSRLGGQLDDIENKFAPIPEPIDDSWKLLLIDLITLGALSTSAPFFNSVLKTSTFFGGEAQRTG